MPVCVLCSLVCGFLFVSGVLVRCCFGITFTGWLLLFLWIWRCCGGLWFRCFLFGFMLWCGCLVWCCALVGLRGFWVY